MSIDESGLAVVERTATVCTAVQNALDAMGGLATNSTAPKAMKMGMKKKMAMKTVMKKMTVKKMTMKKMTMKKMTMKKMMMEKMSMKTRKK